MKTKLKLFSTIHSQGQIDLVVIVASGDCLGEEVKNILQQANFVIAADGGANSCVRLNRVPDIVIGDLDSVDKKVLVRLEKNKRTKIIYDPDQNKTDLELAIKILNGLRPRETIILGALGNRFDHVLANMIVLDKINKKIKFKIVAPNHEIFFVTKKIDLVGQPGDIISVIPLTPVTGLTYIGLKWNLKDQSLPLGWIGVRNVLVGKHARITLKSGKVLIIKIKK